MDVKYFTFFRQHRCSGCGKQTVGLKFKTKVTNLVFCDACYEARYQKNFQKLLKEMMKKK